MLTIVQQSYISYVHNTPGAHVRHNYAQASTSIVNITIRVSNNHIYYVLI